MRKILALSMMSASLSFCVYSAALAQDDGPFTESSKAFKLVLQADDFKEIIAGSSELARDHAIVGNDTSTTQQSILGIPLIIRGIDYSFLISSIKADLEDGAISVRADLKDLRALVSHVAVWDDQHYCKNIPIVSNRQVIPVKFKMKPEVSAEGLLKLPVSDFALGLTSENFTVLGASKCDLGIGLDWIFAEYIIPGIANFMRNEIGNQVSGTMGQKFAKVTDSFNAILTTELTLPFNLKPIKPFYATTGIRPETMSVTKERILFELKARLRVDPDDVLSLQEQLVSQLVMLQDAPSTAGISVKLFTDFIGEAHKKGVLNNLLINAETLGVSKDYFEAGVIGYKFLPQLMDIVGEKDPFELNLASMDKIYFSSVIEPTTNAVKLQLNIDQLKIDVLVNGKRYATLVMDIKAPVGLLSDAQNVNKVSVNFRDLSIPKIDAVFDASFPRIDRTHTLDKEGFISSILTLNDMMRKPEKSKLFTITLPDIKIGSRQLSYEPITLDDNYLTLAFKVKLKK